MKYSDDIPTYEQALSELDGIVRSLEDGQIGLEDSLAQFERGIGLIKTCYEKLSQAEQRIQSLCGIDEHGQPVLQPFAHASAMASPKADSTRRAGKPLPNS